MPLEPYCLPVIAVGHQYPGSGQNDPLSRRHLVPGLVESSVLRLGAIEVQTRPLLRQLLLYTRFRHLRNLLRRTHRGGCSGR